VTVEAKITRGYNLTARWVIHTVGPVWRGGGQGEDELLARCYRSCLALAERCSIGTIAFPAISPGAYGFPLERSTAIAVAATRNFLSGNETVEQVTFVCFREAAYRCYLARLRQEYASLEMPNVELRELSMGMTEDYPVAIEEGATIVRIGRAIFGERH
jgi:O-acetyl-ADP-ribose deacetylase (regulator of RNase III)